MTARELEQVNATAGFQPPIGAHLFGAPEYRIATLDWVKGDFIPYARKHLKRYGLHKWQEHVWDCNLLADFGAILASICHAKTDGAGATQLAVGRAWYDSRARRGFHASTAFLVEDFQHVFIDLDVMEPFAPSRKEIESCTYLRF
jgi:hypothetical protein